MLFGMAVRAATYDDVAGMRSVPQIFFGMTRLANAAPVAWFGQACATQLDLDPETVLSIMRYP